MNTTIVTYISVPNARVTLLLEISSLCTAPPNKYQVYFFLSITAYQKHTRKLTLLCFSFYSESKILILTSVLSLLAIFPSDKQNIPALHLHYLLAFIKFNLTMGILRKSSEETQSY